MKSETWTIQQVFQDRKQYKVPFYQRAYVWTLDKQWPLLWADIKDKAEERLAGTQPAPHFLGAIVVEPQEKVGLRGVDTLNIIDGQQRLTTLQYVLVGIRLATRELKITDYDSYLAAVLDNPNPTTMANAEVEVFKVWPTFSDQKAFLLAMTADKLATLQARYPAHFTQAGTFRRIGIVHRKKGQVHFSSRRKKGGQVHFSNRGRPRGRISMLRPIRASIRLRKRCPGLCSGGYGRAPHWHRPGPGHR